MSVEPEEVKAEEPEEETIEDAIFSIFNGEDGAEEPENSQPEVVAEAEDNLAVAEPEPPVEGQEESALPEWAQSEEFDINDPDTAAAIEFWAGGEKAEWTRKRFDEMTEDQAAKLKAAQAAKDRYEAQLKKETEEPKDDLTEWARQKLALMRAEDEAKRKAQAPELEPEAPAPVDIKAKVREMLENGETEAAYDVMVESLKAEQERKLAEMQKTIDQRLEEKLDAKLTETQTKSYWASFDKYGMELRDKDPRFSQMLVNDASGTNALRRILEMGADPITGEVIYKGENPIEDINRAYDYYLGLSRGGKRVLRPATSAQPPAGSTSGSAPEISADDLDTLDMEEFLRKYCWDDFVKLSRNS